MAQSEATVTPAGPTPPTNLLNAIGATPPTPAYPLYDHGPGKNPPPGPWVPPFVDDGAAGALNALVAPSAGTPWEATGTIVTVTAPGSRAECPTMAISVLGNYTATPNGSHASVLAPAVAPTITGLLPVAPTAIGGSTTLTVDGTGFRPNSVVTINGVPFTTQFNSATQLRVLNAPRRSTAGTLPVAVLTGGQTTANTNWTFT